MISNTAWPELAPGDNVIVEHRVDGWSRVVTVAELLPPLPGAGEGIVTTTGKVYQHFSFRLEHAHEGVDDQALVDAVFDRLAIELAESEPSTKATGS